jgi:hypothetical protein
MDLEASLKWFVFATAANDRRRHRYARMLGRSRAPTVRRRVDAAAGLDPPVLPIPEPVGFVVDRAGALGDTAEVVAEVQRLAAALAPPADSPGTEKPYLHDDAVTGLEPDHPLAELALREEVVSAASAYLGIVPVLAGIHILRSPFVPGEPSGSQLFHSDWEDVRQVKLFVNCSAVEPANGPLVAVTAGASRRVKHAVGYRYGGPHFRLRDDEVLPLVTDEEVTAFTGAPGTATMIDTSSCLHYGSRCEPGSEPRLVVQIQYLTPTAFDLVGSNRRRPAPVVAPRSASRAEALLLGDRVGSG